MEKCIPKKYQEIKNKKTKTFAAYGNTGELDLTSATFPLPCVI